MLFSKLSFRAIFVGTRSGLIFGARPNFGRHPGYAQPCSRGHLTRFSPIFGPYGACLGTFLGHFVARTTREELVFKPNKFLSISTYFM